MKSSIIAVGALLLSVVTAQPHGHYKRHHAVYPRAAVVPDHGHQKREVVVVTDYVDIIETVHMVATVYVDKAGNTIRPAETAVAVSTATGKPVTKRPHVLNEHSSQAYAPKKTPEPVAAPKVEEKPAPAPAPAPPAPKVQEMPAPAPAPPAPAPVEPEPAKPSSTATVQLSSVAPKPAPSPEQPAPQPEPVYVAPKVEEEPAPSPEPVYVAPKVEEKPAPAPEPILAPVEVSKIPVAQAAAPAPAPVSGECNSGSPCSGDITFYQAGLGACGDTHDGDAEAVVALPHGFMGTQSNGNPFCGRTVTIKKNGKTVDAKVVDKCMGCVGSDLDLSNKAFSGLGIDYDVGRTTAEWWFTS